MALPIDACCIHWNHLNLFIFLFKSSVNNNVLSCFILGYICLTNSVLHLVGLFFFCLFVYYLPVNMWLKWFFTCFSLSGVLLFTSWSLFQTWKCVIQSILININVRKSSFLGDGRLICVYSFKKLVFIRFLERNASFLITFRLYSWIDLVV